MKRERLLLVVGDSLPYPRGSLTHGPTEIWANRLFTSGNFDAMWFQPVGGSRVSEMRKRLERALSYLPKHVEVTVIVSQGIVDITPRPFPFFIERPVTLLEYALKKFLGFKLGIKRWKFLYRTFGRPWTSRAKFVKEAEAVARLTLNREKLDVFWLKILEPGPELVGIVGEFSPLCINAELTGLSLKYPKFQCVDLRLSKLLGDGHHLSKQNHDEIVQQLSEVLVTRREE